MTTPPVAERVGWATPQQARSVWPDAPKADATLIPLLTAAYEMCVAYAPHLAAPDDEDYTPASRLVQAQVLMARAVWTAARASADGLGLDDATGLITTAQPTLTAQVKQLLRPTAGLPGIA